MEGILNDPAWHELTVESIDTIRAFMKQPSADKAAVTAVRAAQAGLGAASRHEQSMGAQQATMFMMAREVARDGDELAAILKTAMPDSAVVKALPKPPAVYDTAAEGAWEKQKK